jgi:hypothetical protein
MGWRAFLEGCVATEWRGVQQVQLTFKKSRRSSFRWITSLILKLWEVAWDQGEHRNGILHDRDSRALETATDIAVRVAYGYGSQSIRRRDRHFFNQSLPDLLAQSLHVRQSWLASVTASRAYQERHPAEDRARANYDTERRGMNRWVIRQQPHPTSTR